MMAREKYILVNHYCQNSHIEDTFIMQLQEYGLISFEEKQNNIFIDEKDISEIERLFRLHHDLGINFEGLDAIKQMLKRMQKLENELTLLQKKLRLYE
ncbi:chaperone modulator CbpM [Aequorivita sp. SDUM287046]|uniref:Chaperone modulator CbpM n=1 Tax=Aequorivita aurantiaca TaxID=3053356 RepID=A0ABT8DEC4_9FLAO|nr:chaperone modulator CbpM [Aequorivita aurantiaca]MDN3723641.1 chaperone modulator CbpM [Aequorivita aurantiaca]